MTMNHNATAQKTKLSRQNIRMIFTAGIGFFTDAYDLFIIGVVTVILAPIWHLSVTQVAILNGAALASAAFGAVFFGALSDHFGRKKMYGTEVLILFIGALLSALSPSFTWLLVSRIIVGFGIGGDYPSSAVVASEHAQKQNRGFLVLLVFAMQSVGLIFGPLLASFFLAINIPHHIAWRLLLAFGTIPAASVFYLRRTIQETSIHHVEQAPMQVSRAVSELGGYRDAVAKPAVTKQKLLSRKWLTCLLGTAGSWFLLDVAFYGNSVSSTLIMQKVLPSSGLATHILFSMLIFLIFAVPGYLLAAIKVDTIGRKTLQTLGFVAIAVCYAFIAFIPAVTASTLLFLLIFGISFFFVNFGPNSTTFLIPSEIYPTNIRAKAHGLSAAIGKVGAFVGAFGLPILLHSHGLNVVMIILSIVCIIGVFLTRLVPEMTQVSLDETETPDTTNDSNHIHQSTQTQV